MNAADERLMSIILRGKDQIENFMKDFLLLARPSPGTIERIELRNLISDVVEAIQYTADWHEGIRIALSGDDVAISANRAELRQLIWNLLMNAVQSIPEKGTVEVSLKRTADPVGAALDIRDTGSGMRKEVLQKVFEPFTRLVNAGRDWDWRSCGALSRTREDGSNWRASPDRGPSLPFGCPRLRERD